jgi:glutaconyl-CoA decarboxylase
MKFKVSLNNAFYEVEVEKAAAQSIGEYAPNAGAEAAALSKTTQTAAEAALPAAPPASQGGNFVKAPLPGTVVKINVQVGQNIKAGEIVAVIESMKMENEIASSDSGTVKAIFAPKGAQVQTGAPLIELA